MKEKRKKLFRWVIIVLGVLFLFGNRGFRNLVRGQFRLSKLNKELAKLNRQNQELRRQLYSLEKDPSLIERIAREKLNFIKPGETIYRFVPKEKK